MNSLKEQLVASTDLSPSEVVRAIIEELRIEERGGGPEGIYYTHPMVDGEFLYRNLPMLVKEMQNLYEHN